MSARKKLILLTTFLVVSAGVINNLFDMGIPEDEIYTAQHMTRARTRPLIDLSLELKDEVGKLETKPKEKKVQPKKVQNGTSDDGDEDEGENAYDKNLGEIAYEEYLDDDDMDDMIITDSTALLRAYSIEEKLELFSDGDDLHDWTAPQGRAFQWIVNEDERMIHADDPHLIQRYVLAVIFYATEGFSWHNGNLHWLSGVHECYWTKKIKGRPMGVVECDDDNNVSYIELVENNLQGSLPKEIGWLESLISLDLQENRLTGSVPSTLGNIESLKNMFINSNSFTGTIPTELGRLGNLTLLLLDTNELRGAMPDEVCTLKNNSHLYSLWADCDGTDPPINCNCCSMCCDGLGYCMSPLETFTDMDDAMM